MSHPALRRFEARLQTLFREVDALLEERYGHRYRLHPNRAEEGRTSAPEHDGLFNIGASFSAGYGSDLGRGYVIEIRMVTLENVPHEERFGIESEAAELIDRKLKEHFPDRELDLARDGQVFKIYGDLSLGET